MTAYSARNAVQCRASTTRTLWHTVFEYSTALDTLMPHATLANYILLPVLRKQRY